MPLVLELASNETLSIKPWPDHVIDAVGQHPCSSYVETFWLGFLGPSTTWLLRHLVTSLELSPQGFELTLSETAQRLGLGQGHGRSSAFIRSIGRLVHFKFAELHDTTTLAVRMRVPPLTRAQQRRLPELLQRAHESWQQAQLQMPAMERQRQRARQLALSYLEARLGVDETERQLMRLDYHPAICHDAVRWAIERHRRALTASVRSLPAVDEPREPLGVVRADA